MHISHQNGRVETRHGHVLNVARALHFHVSINTIFFGQGLILLATSMINRTPTKLLNDKTPYECLHECLPSYDLARTFGCLCYTKLRDKRRDKFDARSRKCIFVSYLLGRNDGNYWTWKLRRFS